MLTKKSELLITVILLAHLEPFSIEGPDTQTANTTFFYRPLANIDFLYVQCYTWYTIVSLQVHVYGWNAWNLLLVPNLILEYFWYIIFKSLWENQITTTSENQPFNFRFE